MAANSRLIKFLPKSTAYKRQCKNETLISLQLAKIGSSQQNHLTNGNRPTESIVTAGHLLSLSVVYGTFKSVKTQVGHKSTITPIRIGHIEWRRCLSTAPSSVGINSTLGGDTTSINKSSSVLETIEQSRNLPILDTYVHHKYSYLYGRSNKSLIYVTVGELIDEMTNLAPDCVKVISPSENVTKSQREFSRDIDQLVRGMKKLGIVKGDSIGLFAYNCYKWLNIQFACAKLGAILNPINPSYRSSELSHVLGRGKVKALFMPGYNSAQYNLNHHLEVLHDRTIWNSGSLDHLKTIILMDELDDSTLDRMRRESPIQHTVTYLDWGKLISGGEKNDEQQQQQHEQVEPNDPLAIYYTSGTTGKPKGALITQFSSINNSIFGFVRTTAKKNLHDCPPRICCPLPLFHVFAGVLGGFSLVTCPQASMVLTSYKYDIEDIVETAIMTNCTMLFTTPTILLDLISYLESDRFTSRHNIEHFPIATITCGGAPVPADLFSRLFKTIVNLRQAVIGYGATENSSLSNLHMPWESLEDRSQSVGSPIDFTEVKIVNATNGKTTLIGEAGEVYFRGFSNMIEYVDDPDGTQKSLTRDNWYRTGDLGLVTNRGTLRIIGRIKDMIIKGGENIDPSEIETLLMTNDSVDRASVIGVPDERYGEEICAWVKLKQSSYNDLNDSDLIAYCKDRISYFKVPKYIIFTDYFPMTPTKKIQKNVMRDTTTKLLKL